MEYAVNLKKIMKGSYLTQILFDGVNKMFDHKFPYHTHEAGKSWFKRV